VTAIGFAAGSALHAVAFLLIGLGIYLYGLDYPAWRHPVMASADAAIAWIAVRRPQWLILALATWVIEDAGQWLRRVVRARDRCDRRGGGRHQGHKALATKDTRNTKRKDFVIFVLYALA